MDAKAGDYLYLVFQIKTQNCQIFKYYIGCLNLQNGRYGYIVAIKLILKRNIFFLCEKTLEWFLTKPLEKAHKLKISFYMWRRVHLLVAAVCKSGNEKGETRVFLRVSYLFWTNKQTVVFFRQPLVEGDEKRREKRAHACTQVASSLVELLVDYVVPRTPLFLSLTADISFALLAAKKRRGLGSRGKWDRRWSQGMKKKGEKRDELIRRRVTLSADGERNTIWRIDGWLGT